MFLVTLRLSFFWFLIFRMKKYSFNCAFANIKLNDTVISIKSDIYCHGLKPHRNRPLDKNQNLSIFFGKWFQETLLDTCRSEKNKGVVNKVHYLVCYPWGYYCSNLWDSVKSSSMMSQTRDKRNEKVNPLNPHLLLVNGWFPTA